MVDSEYDDSPRIWFEIPIQWVEILLYDKWTAFGLFELLIFFVVSFLNPLDEYWMNPKVFANWRIALTIESVKIELGLMEKYFDEQIVSFEFLVYEKKADSVMTILGKISRFTFPK